MENLQQGMDRYMHRPRGGFGYLYDPDKAGKEVPESLYERQLHIQRKQEGCLFMIGA